MEQHLPARPSTDPENMTEGGVRFLQYLTAAQRDRRIRDDLAADWLFAALIAVITRASGHRFDGGATRTAMVRATVTSILSAPAG
jgi:hypothetical protein